jgi:hypothetical protein
MDGIYYQKTLGSPRGSGPNRSQRPPSQIPSLASTAGPKHLTNSASASGIVDSSSADFVAEMHKRLGTPPWHLFALIPGVAAFVLGLALRAPALVAAAVAILFCGGAAGYAIYRVRRTTEVHYQLDPHYGNRYSGLLAGFEQLRCSERLWVIESSAAVQDARYHAGAASVIGRGSLVASFGTPSFLRCNIKIPMLEGRKQALYFLPDMLLVVQCGTVGAVSYSNLGFASSTTTFIEHGPAPRDSQQIGTRWQYTNKGGGPDRRFSNNREIPVLTYALMRFHSKTGLDEQIQGSNVPAATAFAHGLAAMIQPAVAGNVVSARIIKP